MSRSFFFWVEVWLEVADGDVSFFCSPPTGLQLRKSPQAQVAGHYPGMCEKSNRPKIGSVRKLVRVGQAKFFLFFEIALFSVNLHLAHYPQFAFVIFDLNPWIGVV